MVCSPPSTESGLDLLNHQLHGDVLEAVLHELAQRGRHRSSILSFVLISMLGHGLISSSSTSGTASALPARIVRLPSAMTPHE